MDERTHNGKRKYIKPNVENKTQQNWQGSAKAIFERIICQKMVISENKMKRGSKYTNQALEVRMQKRE